MGIHRDPGADAVDGANISPSSITDDADGQAWETLQEIGYEKGDVIPLIILSADGTEHTISSSTYTNIAVDLRSHVPPADSLGPVNQLVIGIGANITPGTDETAYLRAKGVTGPSLSNPPEVSASTSTDVWSGYVDYDISSTADLARLITEAKTEPGANTSNITDRFVILGVRV